MTTHPEPFLLALGEGLEAALEAVPSGPAVFAIWPRNGEPYLGRTALLRRRLKRMMRTSLRTTAERVAYWPVGSSFEGALVLYTLARDVFPDRYLEFLKLRLPYFLKLVRSSSFPRLTITRRVDGGAGQFFGPFRSRASAELFEHQFLDLFQIRRCIEDLQPNPSHPGCIYGEMNMCLRPCQAAVGIGEYASEVARVSEFLHTSGRTPQAQTIAHRDRLSEEMDFEGAAQLHKRVEKIEATLSLRDELAADIDRLYGVAITNGAAPGEVLLWPLWQGTWQGSRSLSMAEGNQTVSLDARVKEVFSTLHAVTATPVERGEHIALLARWYYSSWREGEWIQFDDPTNPPYRKLVNAVSRTARAGQR